jgi:hypothetical protein
MDFYNFKTEPVEPRNQFRRSPKPVAAGSDNHLAWARMRAAILNVLKTFPDAYNAVLNAMLANERFGEEPT